MSNLGSQGMETHPEMSVILVMRTSKKFTQTLSWQGLKVHLNIFLGCQKKVFLGESILSLKVMPKSEIPMIMLTGVCLHSCLYISSKGKHIFLFLVVTSSLSGDMFCDMMLIMTENMEH